MYGSEASFVAQPPTSMGLLDRAKASMGTKSEAWSTIARVYTPLVYSWARKTGLDDSDASDISQDVFMKVFLKLDTYEPGRGRFRDWLWQVTRNAVIEVIRKQRRRPVTCDPATLENLSTSMEPILLETDHEFTDPDHMPNIVLRHALEVIRPRVRETTFLAAWRTLALGLPSAEVAQGLGISVTAVYIARSRVRKELRRILIGLEF